MFCFKEGHCILFFRPRTRTKTFLQYFALEQRKYKAKHCRNVLGRVLGQKNKLHAPSFRQLILYVITFLVLTQYCTSNFAKPTLNDTLAAW